MSYLNTNIDWTSLISWSDNGLVIASYPDIKKAIIDKFKSIYGDDIDISTNTADGIYLEFYSLMINNLLQSFQTLYSNLNIQNATGYYLDILAALKNVKRKQATKSMALIKVTNNGESNFTITQGTKFLDINGQTWTYQNESIVKIAPDVIIAQNEEKGILVFADVYGPVSCYAGTIDSLLEVNSDIDVVQDSDGEIGSFEESDSDLRARCGNSVGLKSMTVLSNMEANLVNILGIQDAKVYNNPVAQTLQDGTSCLAHTTYVVIRKLQNLELSDENIGRIIYNSSTPGIPTQAPAQNVKAGTSKNIEIKQVIDGAEVSGTEVDVYWKEALPIKCNIQFTITPTTNFNNNTYTEIVNSCKEYLNNLKIGQKINEDDLRDAIIYSDPYFLGRRTFTLGNITYKDVEASASNYGTTIPENYNSYYEFDREDGETGTTITLISTRS